MRNRSDNRNRYGVSKLLISLCIRYGDDKLLGEPLQTGTFTRRQLTRWNIRPLVNHYFTTVLIVAGTDGIYIFGILIEHGKAKAITFPLVLSFTTKMTFIQTLADGILFIHMLFQNIPKTRFCTGRLRERELITKRDIIIVPVKPNQVNTFTILRNTKVTSTQDLKLTVIIKVFNMLQNNL